MVQQHGTQPSIAIPPRAHLRARRGRVPASPAWRRACPCPRRGPPAAPARRRSRPERGRRL